MNNMEPVQSPYGTWKSPVSALDVSREGVGVGHFSDLSVDQIPDFQAREVFWAEVRPEENGRSILYSYDVQSKCRKQWTPSELSARSQVHEYGGGAILIVRGVVYFSNMEDQRIYRQTAPDAKPEPLTPAVKYFYADGCYSPSLDCMFYIREDHTEETLKKGNGVITSIVKIDPHDGTVTEVVSGSDFYSSPRVSPDGARLAWLEWNHPNMPWDDTRLMVVELNDRGLSSGNAQPIVKGTDDHQVSVLYPVWTRDGGLIYAGDHDDYWDLYRINHDGSNRRKIFSRGNRDVVGPPWMFELSCFWYRADSDTVAVNVVGEGMVEVNVSDGTQRSICKEGDHAILVRGSPGGRLFVSLNDFKSFPVLICIEPLAGDGDNRENRTTVLARSVDVTMNPADISIPRHIEFDTTEGAKAFGYYYPPKNSSFRCTNQPNGSPPPLIVEAHGGPTSAASRTLRFSVQFWTTRGFALVDVDYRGSSGYGRRYRNALRGKWGIYDVDDCCAAVQYLVRENLADRDRICIHGGSAGGFTTLACLAFREVFSVGASYYGVADLGLLMDGTHKFESHYLETLIGPWPSSRHLFTQRSPLTALDRFSCPVIFFQGDDDKVVPPEQAKVMFNALKEKGIMTALLMFHGEQHGFRMREHIVQALEGELFFYNTVLGLNVDKNAELPNGGVVIENLNVRTRRLTS